MEARDGVAATVAWAREGARIYRACVLRSRKRGYDKPHHCSLPEYRRRAIESYLAFKRYVREHAGYV